MEDFTNKTQGYATSDATYTPTWLFDLIGDKDSVIAADHLLIYAAILRNGSPERLPSIRVLADNSGLSRHRVRELLPDLAAVGAIATDAVTA